VSKRNQLLEGEKLDDVPEVVMRQDFGDLPGASQ
jgi:hypothetical protein